MRDLKKQWEIKFCFNLSENYTEMFQMSQQAYEQAYTSWTSGLLVSKRAEHQPMKIPDLYDLPCQYHITWTDSDHIKIACAMIHKVTT